ncbi:Cadherin-related tumor suppressor [Hypsibius exemplaris]|uniref:Cadherin-related tumor suppressor n=1 Tax=Hypsibius exemplaris TaxID=2072580 RepID=A0A1W0X1X5_HYPEX|nr:Cadherin-related tumor suppressor [Hypsibius exemplaris]
MLRGNAKHQLSFFPKRRTASSPAASIRIRVLSVNNRTPKFTSPYYRFKLPASAPVGLKLGQVAASDMDKSDSITFHLNGPVATDILTINQETGEIYLKRVPTNSGRVCFDVSADDSVHRSNVTCCVDVETPEHLVPAFTHDKYEFTVFVDDMEDGEQIGAVTVVGRGEKYEYFQSAEWFDNTFLVDRRSGAISVTESRFFTDSADEVKTVVLQIEASATSHPKSTNSTLVFITLLHSNSHQQVLPPLAARVSENASIGHCFADFFRDKHSVMKDDVVPRWTIHGDPHGHFSVSPLGLVCVRSPLDREAQSGVELTVSLHSGIYRAERPIFITIEDVNDEPPKFSSSIPTTLLIPRSTQITTEILKVHATDPDTGSGGEVQYRLISPENDFSIDTFSGVVRLNDADSLDSKPSFRLEIIAFDRGEPSLSATATCIVTVVHENLHAPRFTRSKYAVDVPENVSISHSVISLSATDYDQAGQHSDLRFWIIDGNSEELFQIDQATGQIFTAAALDYERQTSYELTVLVEDSSKNDTAVVSVYLQNVDDERPRFPTEEYHVQVMENWGGGPTTKTRLLQVHAVDADVPPFNEVRYRVKSGDGGSAFEVDEVTGWISLRQTLDREERDVYQVEIEARNAGISTTDTSGSAAREAASVLVVISVVDENDNAPVFTSKAVYHVKENSSNGTLVGDLVAVDRDLNATLRYVILTPAPFAVNSRTGKITTVGALDMKHAFEYHLVVQVDDGLHFVRTNVTVRLDDVDNHAPVFRPDSVTRYIPDSVSAGHFVVQAFAADADPSDPPCQYISNALDGFSLNQLTGVVTVSTPKLRLTSPVELSIQTTNQPGSTLQTSARMALQIHQAPAAHFPTFQSTTGVLTLSETTALDQIARVTAVPGTTVGPLTYRIAGGNSDGTFSIDSVTGQVRLEKPLDFEKFPRRDLWLEAAVDKYATPLLLQIEVKNVNDNAPVFTRDCFEVEVDEEETPRTFYTVAATDADGDALKYRLLNGTELFSLDQHSGGLRNTVKLDREKMGEMAVRVEASDGQFVTETQVRVVLRDKNDNPPKFSRQFTATVMENAPIGTLVVKVASVDADSPINAQAWYSLADESSRLFTIGRESGEVRVARNIDRELYSEIPLEILVRDGSWQSKSLVMITVVGQNDHAPEFSQPEYVFFVLAEDVEGRSVTRKMGSLTSFNPVVIGQVSAVDGDENDIPNELSYSLKQHSTHFSIDRTSGRITAKRPLFTSANKPETFNLTVFVTEEAPMRRSTDTAVRITLLPKLPVTPAFAQSTFQLVMQMSELAPNNQVIRLTTRPSEISPKFAILSGNGSACFRLDTTRGTIQTLASVANCTVGTYQFQVAALYTDRSATTKTTVIIRLTEEPPQPVRFPADMYEVSVPETAAAGSVLFTAASAKTGDDSGATVGDDSGTTVGDDSGATVGDDSGATVGDDSGATVGDDSDLVQYSLVNHTDVFQVDSTTGAVRLKKQLDYESVREYAVQVTATASATQTATTTLIVSVLNENDNPPCFEETAYTAVLLESDKLGQTVITVRAADPDASSAPVYYTLEPESALFEIDSARGVITNVKELDYESARNHTLVVRAMDPADPSLYSEVAVLVVVEGRNEYPPVCAPGSPFVFSISAHAPAGTRIGDVFGTDADSGLDGVIEYFLVGNSPGFAVNQTSGQISMTSSQTVTVSEHHLHVLLKNSGTVAEVKSVVCDVVIHVVDGKNTPYFMQKEYFVRVREDVTVGTKVGVVSAMTVLQQKLRFTLTAGDDKGDGLRVGVGRKELSSTAMVHVTVEDVNDNAPFFDPALPSGHVKENLHYETAVLKLNATDRDLTPSFLTYRLASPAWKDHFKLNPSSGVLTAIRPLDREANPEIILKVNVSDSGSPPQTATLDVRVVVDDVNDNPSVERPLTIVVYLDELSNSNTKRRLGNVKPADRDEQGEYACQITDIQTNFAVEEGCELIGQDLRPGELYRLTVQGGDGKHDLVRYEVIVKAEAVTKLHHENSIAVRLAGVTAERFLDAHYVRLMQTLFGVFRNYGPVSVFGLTTLSATDCVVQISIGKSTTFLKGAKVADLMRMNMGEIEAQSGLKIGSVDFKPCETQSITALCSQTSVCENLIQTVPHQSTITTTASLIIVAPLFEYSHRCVCAEPFSGPQCELLCPPDYCLHGGTCAGNGKCVCRGGFHGSQCQFDLDECNLWGGSAAPNCHNGGKCINTVGSFRCQCTAGFTGRHCEEERRCLGGNCPNSLVNGQSFGFGEVGSHLELRPWKSGSNHVSMVIATTKLDAVLLFTQGPGRSGTAHFVVLEIKKGFVYFAFGSNARDTTRIMVNRAVSDGRWYRIDVVKQDAMGSLTVVSCSEETCDDCPSGDESCSTVAIGIVKRQSFGNNSVYIGGIPAETPLDDPRFKHRTFIGCLKGLTVNGLTVRPSDTRATVGITEDTCGAIYTATPNLCQASSCSTNEICVNSATDGRYECVAAVPDTSDSQTVLIVALVCVTAVVFLLGGIVIWRYRKSTPARKKKANSYSGGRPPYLSPVSLFEQQYLTGSNYNERNGSNRTNGMNGNLYKDNSCIYHGGSQQDGPQHYYCVLREDHLRRPSRPQSHYASASIYESRVGAYANETAATQLARRNLMVASPADGSEEGKQSSASTQPVDVLSLDSADSAVLRYDPRSRHGLTFIPAPRGALDDVISDGCSDCDNCKSAVRSHYEMDNWNRIERYREQPTYAEVGDVLLEQHQIQQHSSSTLRHVLV